LSRRSIDGRHRPGDLVIWIELTVVSGPVAQAARVSEFWSSTSVVSPGQIGGSAGGLTRGAGRSGRDVLRATPAKRQIRGKTVGQMVRSLAAWNAAETAPDP
jgi:hypothetical protein